MKFQLTARRVTGEEDVVIFDEAPEEIAEGGHTTYSGITSGHPTKMVIAPGYYSMVMVLPVSDEPQEESEAS